MTNLTDLTVVVCSNRIEKVNKYTSILIENIFSSCKILILLDKNTDLSGYPSIATQNGILQAEIIVSEKTGLSALRNFALSQCSTKYIIFVDDDVILNADSIDAFCNAFKIGYEVVGLRLIPPSMEHLNKWFITENQYHYLGIHPDSDKKSVWGACMGFNMDLIKQNNLSFRFDLSRSKNKLISGEDTTFIRELKHKGAKSVLLDSEVIHYVDKKRLTFRNFTKRVFHQGISESIRENIIGGLIKEIKRNFYHIKNIRHLGVGLFWVIILLSGEFYGPVYKIMKNYEE